MNVLLYAPDSKFPNLAIMKISAYHKQFGYRVGFDVEKPDLIFASILFPKNKVLVDRLREKHPDAKIVAGGPGFDPSIVLPVSIERMKPDYDLYPPDGYSYGKITTGCPRKCYFCIVPIQEPNGLRFVQMPNEFYRPGTILRIFDDNILASHFHWDLFVSFVKTNRITVHIEYLDIRLVNKKVARDLCRIKRDTYYQCFSFDFTKMEKALRKGVECLRSAGFKPYRIRLLIYCHDENEVPDAKYRWKVSRELGCQPFLMVPVENQTPAMKRIIRRCARPAIWRNMGLDDVFDLEK